MLIFYLTAAAAAFFFIPQLIYAKYWYKGLSGHVFFGSGAIFEGEEEILYEEVENAKGLFLPVVKVKFCVGKNLKFEDTDNSSVTDYYYRNDIFTMKGNQRIRRQLAFRGMKRGYYAIGGISLVCSDLFLIRQDVLEMDNSSSLYVYPGRLWSGEFRMLLNHLNGEVLTKNHSIPDPFEYMGIREYEPWDSMKEINWKATAKTGEYKVNVKDHTSHREVRIFLDLYNIAGYHREEMQELCIRAAAGIAENFCRQGLRVSICSNGRDTENGGALQLGPEIGPGFLNGVYRGLARIDLDREISNFAVSMGKRLMDRPESAYTVVISSDAGKALQDALSAFLNRSGEILWIYATDKKEKPLICPGLKKYVRYIGREERAE